jgi:hypothetical protein
MFNVPVLFIIYNRPEHTQKVFEQIRRIKPRQLFISADGARTGEEDLCQHTRMIVERIDWECEVKRRFFKKNQGCRIGVSSAIDWFFSFVPEGIILEDDTVPHISFFDYAQKMLAYYRDDQRIMHIAGTNRGCKGNDAYSYYFSCYVQIWGWATWRRAWQKYDVTMSQWPLIRDDLKHYIHDMKECSKRYTNFEKVYNQEIDTWDYQWHFAVLMHHGLAVIPRVNMISNIGFAHDATHTKNAHDSFANLPLCSMDAEIKHPPHIMYDNEFELLHH